MMGEIDPVGSLPSTTRRVAMVLLLAVVGGGVDAVIVISFKVLSAAQTGNTIFLAVALSQGHAVSALLSGVSLVSFVIGVAIGEVLMVVRRLPDATLPRVGWTLFVELIALGVLLLMWRAAGPAPASRMSYSLVALAAGAMGIQTAAALRLNAGPITTYVTGTLTSLMVDMIRPVKGDERSMRRDGLLSGNRPFIYGITWLFYFGGALLSGAIARGSATISLLFPMLALGASVIIALT